MTLQATRTASMHIDIGPTSPERSSCQHCPAAPLHQNPSEVNWCSFGPPPYLPHWTCFPFSPTTACNVSCVTSSPAGSSSTAPSSCTRLILCCYLGCMLLPLLLPPHHHPPPSPVPCLHPQLLPAASYNYSPLPACLGSQMPSLSSTPRPHPHQPITSLHRALSSSHQSSFPHAGSQISYKSATSLYFDPLSHHHRLLLQPPNCLCCQPLSSQLLPHCQCSHPGHLACAPLLALPFDTTQTA